MFNEKFNLISSTWIHYRTPTIDIQQYLIIPSICFNKATLYRHIASLKMLSQHTKYTDCLALNANTSNSYAFISFSSFFEIENRESNWINPILKAINNRNGTIDQYMNYSSVETCTAFTDNALLEKNIIVSVLTNSISREYTTIQKMASILQDCRH